MTANNINKGNNSFLIKKRLKSWIIGNRMMDIKIP
jgi:hypothetical protein